MPISQKTMKLMADFSKNRKHNAIVTLVKDKLKQKEFTVSEILSYVRMRIYL